jgi:putative tricarboxylic transport membrane protein
MRVLAQLSDRPLPGYPGVPTLKEAGYDVKATPQIRAVVAPPGVSNEVVAYWEDLFAKLRATPSWKKYVEDNQLEDHFTNSADLSKMIKQIEDELRTQYQAAGIKVVR